MTALAPQLQTRNHDVAFLYAAGTLGLPIIYAAEEAFRTSNNRIPEFRVIC